MAKLFPVILSLLKLTTFAQRSEQEKTIKITGIILVQETGQSLEYATLILQIVADSSKVPAGITDVNGKYKV